MSAGGMEAGALLLLADADDAGAWTRARRERDRLVRDRRRVLLRDVADLLPILSRIGDPHDVAGVGVRHLLLTQWRLFLAHFDVGDVLSFSPLPPVLANLLADAGAHPVPVPAAGGDAAPLPRGDGVWIAVHDAATPATKTSEAIARACAEEGRDAEVWETGPLRARLLLEEDEAAFRAPGGAAEAIRARLDRRLAERNVRAILGLDLNWYLDPSLLLDHPRVERIVSFWFDDVKAWCQAVYNTCYPDAAARLPEALRHPKVVHCCYGIGQLEEMRLLGFENVRLSHLAAPAAYLRRREGPAPENARKGGKAAFVGNPGLNVAPSPELLELLGRNATLEEIRSLARATALRFALAHFAPQIAQEPSIPGFFAHALEVRAREPHAPAASIFQGLRARYPAAVAALDGSGEILNALLVVKMANQFDRPALVHRLWKAGLLDVHSNASAWAAYGVEAAPDVPFHLLPEVYQRYAVHLNGSNACRDATANEKLFEIAACGRVSVNLASPDVLRCYRAGEEGEISAVSSLEEAEARVAAFLADPDAALAHGERARRRTAAEHLWNHRLRGLLP